MSSKSPNRNGKSPNRNGKSPNKNGKSPKNSSKSSKNSKSSPNKNGNPNQTFEYHKIQLGVTHEVGTLQLCSEKIKWQSNHDAALKYEIKANDVKNIEWLNIDKRKKMMKITFNDKSRPHFRLIGFNGEDEFEIDKRCQSCLKKKLVPKGVSVKGWNWGRFVLRQQEMVCRTEDKHILFTMPYNRLNQSVIQAKNEISFEFNSIESNFKDKSNKKQQNRRLQQSDQLMEMRIYIPDDNDPNSTEAAYEEFHSLLQKKAKLEQDKSQIIAWFDKINFRMPRGKKQIQFYPNHFLFRSVTSSYKIEYSQVKRLFVFEQPGAKIAFLVNLKQAVRQGGATYDCLIMEFPEDENCSTKINATEEELKTKYTDRNNNQVLNQEMHGPTYDILSRVFGALSKVKIIAATTFESSQGDRCVRASHCAANGLLYPLEKSIFFIWTPAFIKHTDIDHVEFERVDDSQHVKMFDLKIFLNKHRTKKPLQFSSIDKQEYEPLVKYFLSKPNITLADRTMHEQRVNNSMTTSSRSTRTRKNIKASTDMIHDMGGFDDDEDDDDDDYDMEADSKMLKEDVRFDKQYSNMVDEKSLENLDDDKIIGSDEEEEDFDIAN